MQRSAHNACVSCCCRRAPTAAPRRDREIFRPMQKVQRRHRVRHRILGRHCPADEPRDFIEHVLDLARGAGRPEARAMFGGHGIYLTASSWRSSSTMPCISSPTSQRRRIRRARASRSSTSPRWASASSSYWLAPDESLEGPAQMREWLQLAHGAALRAAVQAREEALLRWRSRRAVRAGRRREPRKTRVVPCPCSGRRTGRPEAPA